MDRIRISLSILLGLCLMDTSIMLRAQQITPLKDTTNIKIEVNGLQILRNNQPIGSFKLRYLDFGLTFLQVYNGAHARIAEATHEQDSTTWTIITPVDQKKMIAPYYQQLPLPGLFRYLVIQGYL